MAEVEFEDKNLGDEFDGSDDDQDADAMDTGLRFEKLTPHQMNVCTSGHPIPSSSLRPATKEGLNHYFCQLHRKCPI